MKHCENFDPTHAGCEGCPGAVDVVGEDGEIRVICRAGEEFIRRIIASSEIPTVDNDLPVFPTRQPAPHL